MMIGNQSLSMNANTSANCDLESCWTNTEFMIKREQRLGICTPRCQKPGARTSILTFFPCLTALFFLYLLSVAPVVTAAATAAPVEVHFYVEEQVVCRAACTPPMRCRPFLIVEDSQPSVHRVHPVSRTVRAGYWIYVPDGHTVLLDAHTKTAVGSVTFETALIYAHLMISAMGRNVPTLPCYFDPTTVARAVVAGARIVANSTTTDDPSIMGFLRLPDCVGPALPS